MLLHNIIFCSLQPYHVPGDSGWCTRHGGGHGKTSDVTEENAPWPRLDPHSVRWVNPSRPRIASLNKILTRFNKIAIQGTPQMAVDKEALICLSRVYSYYFKCNFPLFYVYPALTRYLSILFLNILTLLACSHSSDNLFHTLMVLCENENFLTSNLLCFFTRVKLCPLVILLSLIWKKKV